MFRGWEPGDPSVDDALRTLPVADALEVVEIFYAHEKATLERTWYHRGQWAEMFAHHAAFAGCDPDEMARRHLDWRVHMVVWDALARVFGTALAEHMVLRGEDNLRAAVASGRPVLVTSFHLRHFAIGPPLFAALGLDPVIVAALDPDRVAHADSVHPYQRHLSSRDPLVLVKARALAREGCSLLLYPDIVRGGTSRREHVEFMGGTLEAVTSWVALRQRLGAVAVPCHVVVHPDLALELSFGEPWDPPGAGSDPREETQDLYDRFAPLVDEAKIEWEGWTEAVWEGAPHLSAWTANPGAKPPPL